MTPKNQGPGGMDLYRHTTIATSEAQFQVTDFFDNFSVPMELKDEVGELLGDLGQGERMVGLCDVLNHFCLKSFHCSGVV